MSEKKNALVSFAVFIAGLCSIIYELLISTTASYFLGDSVKQFSLIIGIYLFAMGVGAFVSKYYQHKSIRFFIRIEYALGLIGGLSVPILYFLFVNVHAVKMQYFTYLLIFVIGLLTGMEVPLLTYAIKNRNIKDSFSNVLSLDYLGGLIATLLFPFLLLPFVGLFYSSLLFGIVNIVLGLYVTLRLKEGKKHILLGIVPLIILLGMMVSGDRLLHIWDAKIYKAPVVYKEQTSHQLIVLTKREDDVRLFLNRVIQFSSKDEHRYHETLVHPVILMHENAINVLILGGGENLASREVLKHKQIETIDVVDLDSVIFKLAKTHPDIRAINNNAAHDPKVNLIVDDAFRFLSETDKTYDIIIADLPDPNSEATAKLYTKQFFGLAKNRLSPNGLFVTQAGEIYFSNTAFSCINNTMNEVFEATLPLHIYVPSFGDWGFVIGSNSDFLLDETNEQALPVQTYFLTSESMKQIYQMPKDIAIVDTKINSLDHPVILNYYLDDWKRWKPDLVEGYF